MPVTAKLSRLFYERFGEQVTNELVDWFNQVDATYRNELREINESNFARFDAKLEQRVAELRAEFVATQSRLEAAIAALRADLRGEFRSGLAELRGDSRSSLERAFRVQTACFFVAWATMFATMVVLGLRR